MIRDKIRDDPLRERNREAVERPEDSPAASPRGAASGGWRAWLECTPFWALSALLHLLFFLVLLGVVYRDDTERDVQPPVAHIHEVRPPIYDPEPPTSTRERHDPLQNIRAKLTPVEHKPIELEPTIPKGTPEKPLSGFEAGAYSALTPIGFGPNSGGQGQPWAGRRPGPGGAGRDAVRAALEWLLRHQSPDGSWKARDFTLQCRETCGNLEPERYGDGRGFPEHDIGVTALAMLAFAGYGVVHLDDSYYPEYAECLRKAVKYLLRVQVHSGDPTVDGRFGSADHEQWTYDHSIATLALAELCAISRDLFLERPVTRAVRLCLRAQNDGYGWRYGVRPGDNDTSVTGWMVLALKTASLARLDIPPEHFDRSFHGALRWIDHATTTSGKTGYMAPGDEGSRLVGVRADPYPFSKELSCMTGVGVLCRIFSGESRRSRTVRNGVKLLMKHPPRWQEQKGRAPSTVNLYYWYYASYALFQYGGREWERWNAKMLEALLASQRRGGDEDGSWDPIGEWGVAGGRVYSTALGAMTLEVYYRYRRLQEGLSSRGTVATR